MAYPISAYFGRKTYAFLEKCCFCGKPYNESGEFTTMQSENGKVDVWLIACKPCMEKLEADDDR